MDDLKKIFAENKLAIYDSWLIGTLLCSMGFIISYTHLPLWHAIKIIIVNAVVWAFGIFLSIAIYKVEKKKRDHKEL